MQEKSTLLIASIYEGGAVGEDATGVEVSCGVGGRDGRGVGGEVGSMVGNGVGFKVGRFVGTAVGLKEGSGVGSAVGVNDGSAVGGKVGLTVGRNEGVKRDVGANVGMIVVSFDDDIWLGPE